MSVKNPGFRAVQECRDTGGGIDISRSGFIKSFVFQGSTWIRSVLLGLKAAFSVQFIASEQWIQEQYSANHILSPPQEYVIIKQIEITLQTHYQIRKDRPHSNVLINSHDKPSTFITHTKHTQWEGSCYVFPSKWNCQNRVLKFLHLGGCFKKNCSSGEGHGLTARPG